MTVARLVGAWASVAMVFAIGIATRLANPDMSETRLVLEFWPRWVVAAGLACVAVWLSSGTAYHARGE